MYLEEIVGNVQLENSTVECKSKLNREDVVGWLKTSPMLRFIFRKCERACRQQVNLSDYI